MDIGGIFISLIDVSEGIVRKYVSGYMEFGKLMVGVNKFFYYLNSILELELDYFKL